MLFRIFVVAIVKIIWNRIRIYLIEWLEWNPNLIFKILIMKNYRKDGVR